MLSSKIKLKQMLNSVGNITIYKSLIVTVFLQFSLEVIENRSKYGVHEPNERTCLKLVGVVGVLEPQL